MKETESGHLWRRTEESGKVRILHLILPVLLELFIYVYILHFLNVNKSDLNGAIASFFFFMHI